MSKKTTKSLFTKHKLGHLLKISRNTVDRHLFGVPPDSEEGGRQLYKIETLEKAIRTAREQRSGSTALRDAKLEQEVRKLRLYNDQKENLVVARAAVQGAIHATVGDARKILEQKLEGEYPMLVYGLDMAGIRVQGKKLGDQIVEELQKLAHHWAI